MKQFQGQLATLNPQSLMCEKDRISTGNHHKFVKLPDEFHVTNLISQTRGTSLHFSQSNILRWNKNDEYEKKVLGNDSGLCDSG